MKRILRLTALLMTVLLLTSLALPALADTPPEFDIKPMPLKQWIDVEKNHWGVSLYKLKLSADSRVTVSWRACTDSNYFFQMFKTAAQAASGSGCYPLTALGPDGKVKGSKTVAVAKGTYYIFFLCDLDRAPSGQVKVTTAAITARSNYSPRRAYALKRNRLERIAQVPLNTHPSWYKIKLAAPQKITISTNAGSEGRFSIYSADMIAISTTQGTKKVVTTEVCPTGTYYIKVWERTSFTNRYVSDSYATLKWK